MPELRLAPSRSLEPPVSFFLTQFEANDNRVGTRLETRSNEERQDSLVRECKKLFEQQQESAFYQFSQELKSEEAPFRQRTSEQPTEIFNLASPGKTNKFQEELTLFKG